MRTRFGLLAVIVLVVVLAAVGATADVLPVSTSWSIFYWSSAPGVMATPSFNLSTSGLTTIQVTDCLITGDQFEVEVDGILRLTTNSVTPDISTGIGSGDAAWADSRLSKGSFDLGAGNYLIKIGVIAIPTNVTNGGAFIRAIPSTGQAVPEPMSMMLGAMGLAAMGGLRKLRVR